MAASLLTRRRMIVQSDPRLISANRGSGRMTLNPNDMLNIGFIPSVPERFRRSVHNQ